MDDLVKQAMAKWPNVPDCYGWLGLDARGNWYMRDDGTQALGAFSSGVVGAKGSRLLHEKLIEFIQRNYSVDIQGQWFFQNGPQRVYVELEATPQVWRLASDFSVTSHSGESARPQRCVVDEHGRVYLECTLGHAVVFGLVHTQDVWQAAEAVEQGLWVPDEVATRELPQRFGYVRSPAALHTTHPKA